MPKYQIRFEEINKQKSRTGLFVAPYKAPRRLNVWEWDTEKKEVKKKGHRFKLELMFIVFTLVNGNKKRDEWYEPMETEVVKSKINK
jgi:hypothetical protein